MTAGTRNIDGRLFWAVVALETTLLLIMIARQEYVLHYGERVYLRCTPVDPRSLFSGDYVSLRYGISTFTRRELAVLDRDGETTYDEDTYLYIALRRKGSFHEAAAVSTSLERLRAEGYRTVIRGRIERSGPRLLSLDFGIEDYFVPQYQGARIERKMKDVSVEAAVTSNGDSAIRRLFIDGVSVEFY